MSGHRTAAAARPDPRESGAANHFLHEVARALDLGYVAAVTAEILPDRASIDALSATLTAQEQAVADRMRFERDRSSYVTAHALLAAAVEVGLGAPPGTWTFTGPAMTKPKLELRCGAPLFASISHTRGCAGLALARTAEVGIDVEAPPQLHLLDELRPLVLTRDECALVDEARDRPSAFARLWTRKEAVLKALGSGLETSPRSVEVADPDTPRLGPEPAPPLTLRDLERSAVPAAACILAKSAELIEIRTTSSDLERALRLRPPSGASGGAKQQRAW